MLNTKNRELVFPIHILDPPNSDHLYRYIYFADAQRSVALSINRY
jgi:hypothetical protein